MKKIFIIGIVASGKTTLARELSKRSNIPWYELDCIVHQKTENERYKRTSEEQAKVISDIDKCGCWIFEGTDRQSYRFLFDLADTIIFLDPSLWKRKLRILLRFFKQQLGIEKCEYKSDVKMLKNMFKWTNEFEYNRQNFESFLNQYHHKLIRLSDTRYINFDLR